MKILHLCLANYYVDGYSYQENVLPRMHSRMGHDVMILASTEVLNSANQIEYTSARRYNTEDGIPIIRLPYVKWLPDRLVHKLRIYSGVMDVLKENEPDLIFLHDIQFMSIWQIRKYVQNHTNVKIIADGHADYINSARGFISKYLLHGIIYRMAVSWIIPFVTKFYGTLPSRVTFMYEMYNIPKDKLDFLPIGADDEIVESVVDDGSRDILRSNFGFNEDDIVFVTGGKIDKNKLAVLELMEAMNRCPDNTKLLIFGSVTSELKEEFEKRLVPEKVVMYGWATENESYQLLNMADVAVFPCLHSTLWEQSAGQGLPCILHEMEGFKHLDINGNCIFVKDCNRDNLLQAIEYSIANIDELRKNAEEASKYFSYKRIAQRVLDELK